MGKKIVVAGGGHGGIAAGMLLAQNGFEVEIYERNKSDEMGYDWTDIFDPKAFKAIGLPMPPENLYEYKVNMTFYSTNEQKPIIQDVPDDEREIKMERRDIYNYLIGYAEKAGVKFNYGYTISGPIVEGQTVVGIRTDKGDIFGDLVIDACGCESPVRANLPESFGIQAHTNEYEKFYIYRAFFNKASQEPVKDAYKICMLPEGKLGIGWVATEENHTDLLIGRFEEFDMAEANRTADYYRSRNASLGTEIVRGNSFAKIPVRQPISKMVANGYAAIGDSAFMTVPMIGSGIANALKAAPLLATAVIKNKDKDYTAEALWEYQKTFYKEIGAGLAPLAIVKLLLTKLTPDELDYIFENDILTWREMTITADSTKLSKMLKFSPDMPARGVAIVKNKPILKKLLTLVKDMAKVIIALQGMPKVYEEQKVLAWTKKYDSAFSNN